MSIASSSAVGPPPGMAVRLSSNEAPFGPSPAAVEAVRRLADDLHLYPDDQSVALRDALAERLGTTRDEVALGTGSAALLMDLVAHECRDGGDVLTYERAFVVYRLGARNAGAGYVEAPTGGPATADADGYARDVDALLERIDESTRLVVVDNPGNPTGAHLTGEELAALVAGVPEHVTVAIDEAWVPPTPFARVPLYILIGAVTDRPVVVDGAVEVRPQLTITATVDHRFIDGFQGGVLAAEFRRVFQDPWSLDGLDGPPARKATS